MGQGSKQAPGVPEARALCERGAAPVAGTGGGEEHWERELEAGLRPCGDVLIPCSGAWCPSPRVVSSHGKLQSPSG